MASSLTSQLVDKRPNTYTYTKALAEYVVKEESHNVPAIIVRPSIIGAVLREPIPVRYTVVVVLCKILIKRTGSPLEQNLSNAHL